MYTILSIFCHYYNKISRVHKIKSTPARLPPYLNSVTTLPSKTTLLLISMLHFQMCNI